MLNQTLKLTLAGLALSLLAAACSQPATPAAGNNNGGNALHATVPAVSNNEGNGEGGVEAALVTYSDAAQGFAIGHPGSWTQDKSFTNGVKFMGGDDYLTVEFVTPASRMDVMAYAKTDVAAVSTMFSGFKQLELAASTEVKGAVILGFEADGKSSVTGKAFKAHNERYYMPLADGRIAVLTVVGPTNHYDREGVRDIALTFNVTK